MNLKDLQLMFNRSASLSLSRNKLLSVFVVLLLCGILVVFFRALALQAGQWLTMSLTFLPIFLCSGILLSTGIVLVRAYHHEVKNKEVSLKKIFADSWEVVLGASYFCIPLILVYLLLWMMLGIFFLLKGTPLIGNFFGVILAFAPFVLNFGMILLCLGCIGMLFFVTPAMALRGSNGVQALQTVLRRFQGDAFSNILLGFIAIFPLFILSTLLALTAYVTDTVCFTCDDPLQIIFQWFFMMIPFVALLSPAIVFFFNFAAESHVMMVQKSKK